MIPAAAPTYEFDSSVRRAGEGRVLVGGSPLVLMRLTAAGAQLIDRLERREPVGAGANTVTLLDRLLEAGIVHPRPSGGPTPGDVTVVIPAFEPDAGRLGALVAACSGCAAVIVVDDASPTAISPVPGAIVIRRPVNGGPAAARTTGLGHVATPFVAFVDVDVTLAGAWLPPLLAHLSDTRVGVVAPRVASGGSEGDQGSGGRLARYEQARSPLDLGREAARVRAGTRVSYVPAAAIVCRVEALVGVGGFDESMRFGEDVDLVWRLDEAGWRVRYEPAVVVHHDPRPNLPRLMWQRFSYGSSAAPLAARHPGAVAPLRVSGWSVASWVTLAAGWPLVGGVIAAATTALLARKLRSVPDGPRLALRLAGLGHLYAGRSLAAAATRAWWPATVVLAVLSKRARRAALAAAVVPALLEWRTERPALDPVTFTALRIVDDVAYGSGVVAGALRRRSTDALLPDLRSWPKSGGRSPQQARKQSGGRSPQPAGR